MDRPGPLNVVGPEVECRSSSSSLTGRSVQGFLLVSEYGAGELAPLTERLPVEQPQLLLERRLLQQRKLETETDLLDHLVDRRHWVRLIHRAP
jgi:hypothetical protein